MVLALFVVSRKLKHYFQTFQTVMLTEHPLKSIVENSQATGRLAKWATELKSYVIKYEPRTAIKRPVLADFITEFTPGPLAQCNLLDGWIFNVDGVSKSKGFRMGIIFITPEGSIIEQSFTLGFHALNHEADYEYVITDLRIASTLGVTGLEVLCDFWW